MALVEQGKVKLDEPVSTYLPCFRNMRYVHSANQVLATKDDGRIRLGPTVRQLLMHTSGITYGTYFGSTARYACEKEYMDLVRRVDSGEVSTLEAFVDELSKLPLRFKPASRWEYSHGVDVLGRVIEVVSGMSLADFLKAKVFDPLGMKDTSFSVPSADVGRLAALYKPEESDTSKGGGDGQESVPPLRRLDGGASSAWVSGKNCGILAGGGFMGSCYRTSNATSSVGGLVSTVADYTRFVQMLSGQGRCPASAKRVLKEETVRSMCSNWLSMRSVAGGQKRIKGWHDCGRKAMGWCPLGQVSLNQGSPDMWMGGIAGTFWAIDGQNDLIVVHATQVAEAYDFYGEELWKAAKAACEAGGAATKGSTSNALDTATVKAVSRPKETAACASPVSLGETLEFCTPGQKRKSEANGTSAAKTRRVKN